VAIGAGPNAAGGLNVHQICVIHNISWCSEPVKDECGNVTDPGTCTTVSCTCGKECVTNRIPSCTTQGYPVMCGSLPTPQPVPVPTPVPTPGPGPDPWCDTMKNGKGFCSFWCDPKYRPRCTNDCLERLRACNAEVEQPKVPMADIASWSGPVIWLQGSLRGTWGTDDSNGPVTTPKP
jgi:hypothetical protein